MSWHKRCTRRHHVNYRLADNSWSRYTPIGARHNSRQQSAGFLLANVQRRRTPVEVTSHRELFENRPMISRARFSRHAANATNASSKLFPTIEFREESRERLASFAARYRNFSRSSLMFFKLAACTQDCPHITPSDPLDCRRSILTFHQRGDRSSGVRYTSVFSALVTRMAQPLAVSSGRTTRSSAASCCARS